MYLKIGETAPNFNIKDQNDNERTLSDFKGNKILIWFYPKASTPGWTWEGQGFRDEFEKFKKNNIAIIGVSADKVKKLKSFAEKQNFLYTLLSDENKKMLQDYKVWGKKKFMGREYDGIHRISYLVNESGIIEKVYEKVKTKSHAKDILNDLNL